MTNVFIVGANGQIARVATQLFLDCNDCELTLYLRNTHRLDALCDNPRITFVEGNARDEAALADAMQGQNVVFANLSGDMPT